MPYSTDLRKQAADFLQRSVPAELQPHYVAGSLADIVITQCAQGQPLDPELSEIAEISATEYDTAIVEAQTSELKACYTECQRLLREIVRASP